MYIRICKDVTHIYVRIYFCVYVCCMYICICVCIMYVCIYVCICIYVYL